MKEALELALEALQVATTPLTKDRQEVLRAITAIKEALAHPEQYPQIAINPEIVGYVALQRTWVRLTDEERNAIFELHHTRLGGWDYRGDKVMYDEHFEDAAAAIEAKLKEKNT